MPFRVKAVVSYNDNMLVNMLDGIVCVRTPEVRCMKMEEYLKQYGNVIGVGVFGEYTLVLMRDGNGEYHTVVLTHSDQ